MAEQQLFLLSIRWQISTKPLNKTSLSFTNFWVKRSEVSNFKSVICFFLMTDLPCKSRFINHFHFMRALSTHYSHYQLFFVFRQHLKIKDLDTWLWEKGRSGANGHRQPTVNSRQPTADSSHDRHLSWSAPKTTAPTNWRQRYELTKIPRAKHQQLWCLFLPLFLSVSLSLCSSLSVSVVSAWKAMDSGGRKILTRWVFQTGKYQYKGISLNRGSEIRLVNISD